VQPSSGLEKESSVSEWARISPNTIPQEELEVTFLIYLINLFAQLITILVIIQVVLSYFMDPYHPIRQTIDRMVEPLLRPIRRFLPKTGMLDFSPLVLIILIQIVAQILVRILGSL
jgi:YggT family protein